MIEEIKPATIRVTLDGISPRSETIDPIEPFESIEWMRIMGLPSFELFLLKKYCVHVHEIPEFMDIKCIDHQLDSLYAQYCAWHKDIALWPGETPEGRLIE